MPSNLGCTSEYGPQQRDIITQGNDKDTMCTSSAKAKKFDQSTNDQKPNPSFGGDQETNDQLSIF
jgi:hypothetical protein